MNYENEIAKILIDKGLKISTVESCTGGLLSSKLTDVSGSSAFISLNLVTYANEAKENILDVTLDNEGVVSENCAYQMAKGLCNLTKSDICVSTTGIAGPTGGSDKKPVGLMYSTIYTKEKSKTSPEEKPLSLMFRLMSSKAKTRKIKRRITANAAAKALLKSVIKNASFFD